MTKLVFGNVKHPAFLDRPIQKREGAGQNDLGQRTVKGVTWHRMLGSLWGTDTFFHRSDVNSLTDYGVGVTAQDGASHAGEILRWNNPLGRQSGWASGTYSSAAYGDGAAFVAKYGINAINRDRASIEISGFQTTPLDEKSKDAVAALTAYWADQYEIPWNVFPIAPQDGFSFVTWHEEFGPDEGQKKCPFDEVKQETPDIIERARAIMKAAQTQGVKPAEPTYATPATISWKPGDLGWKDLNGRPVYALTAEVQARRDNVVRRAWASSEAPKAGENLRNGQKVKAIGSFAIERKKANGKVENERWIVLSDLSRVRASALTPLLPIKP